MSGDLIDTIRRLIRAELSVMRTAELAVVDQVHPHADASDKDNYACSVRLRDSGILLKAVPVATQRIGYASIPAPGELVLVQFLGGDINAPVITGRLYNEAERPPPNAENQAILHLPLDAGDSDAVHVELHSGDSRELSLRLGDGLELTLRDDDPVVALSVDGGQGSVQIDRDGTITITSKSNVKIEGADINIEASGTLTLKGSTVNIN